MLCRKHIIYILKGEKDMNINWKLVGTITTVAGAVLSLVSSIAEGKKTELTIKEEVAEAVAEAVKNIKE
jgi:hypothetical protein